MGEPSTLSALVGLAAEQKPGAIGFIEPERSTAYGRFAELVQRTAAWLHQAGVGPALRPCRTPTNPAAQNSDAPMPQITPKAVELKRLVGSKRPRPFTPSGRAAISEGQ